MDCDGGVAVGVRIVELPSKEASQERNRMN